MEQHLPSATGHMVRKTSPEKRRPTPAQERELEVVRWRCGTRDTVALEQRLTWWRRGQGRRATHFQQEAARKALRAAFAEDAAIHRHVLQEGLARLDNPSHAVFRRLAHGEKGGFPRLQGRDRSHSCSSTEDGNGVRLEKGPLVLSTLGRLAVHWSRPLAGTPTTVTIRNEADGWDGAFACADVPTEPVPRTGREPGLAVGLPVFLVTAEGVAVEHPRHDRPPGGEAAGQSAAAGESAQAGPDAPQEGRGGAGEAAPPRQAATRRSPPPDGAGVGRRLRHDRSRGDSAR